MSNPGTPTPQGVTVIGPDQRKYQFPKGTTKDQAEAYFKEKGIGAATKTPTASGVPGSPDGLLKPFVPPDPSKDTAANIGKQAITGVKELGQSLYNVGKDLVQNPNWVFGHESVFQHVITDPATKQALEANAAWKLHQYDRASIHEIGGMLPIVGPWVADAYESVNTSGDPWGSLAKFESQALGGELAGKAVEAAKKGITPEALRTKAAKLEMQATHTGVAEKALDTKEMASAGRAMAEAKVIGTKLTLPRKLAQLVLAKRGQVDNLVKQADASGRTANVQQSLDTAVDTAKQRAAVLGDRKALDDLDRWKLQQSATLDPKTKTWSPRNMGAVKPSELLADTRKLGGTVNWDGKTAPSHIENATKLYRKALNDHLDQVAPGTAKLRSEEAQLIENRDAAKEQMHKTLEGARSAFLSLYRSPSSFLSYAFLKGLGMSWIGAAAPIVATKIIWDSTLSRTTRAAALQWAADLFDGKRQSAASRGGAPPSQTPSSPAQPPTAPSGPAPTSPQQMILQAVSTMQAVQQAKAALPQNTPVETVMVTAQKIKAVKALQAAVGQQTPQTPSGAPEAPTGQPNAANPLPSNGLQAGATPPVQRVAEGVSGLPPKAKAMMDRLDELTQRRTKSGKDAADVQREIEDIKKFLSTPRAEHELTTSGRDRILKRITDRESVARKRAAAKPEMESTASVTQAGGNVEQQTLLIEQGLNKVKTYGELGKTTAAALAREAKLRKWSAAEQMAQIAESIEFLKAHAEGK